MRRLSLEELLVEGSAARRRRVGIGMLGPAVWVWVVVGVAVPEFGGRVDIFASRFASYESRGVARVVIS